MAQQTGEELRAELARLTAENEQLTGRLERARVAGGAADAGSTGAASASPTKGRGWGWTLLATVLVVIGALLAPVGVASVWAQRELTDTAYFVDTFAPLAQKPAVQDFVANETIGAIESKIDVDGIVGQVWSGLDGLDLPPVARSALGLLKAPAVNGVKSLISDTVVRFVRSDAFATIWRQALTATHNQLVATVTGQKNATITVGQNGQIGVELGPIIAAVRQRLLAQGLTLAEHIPAISKTIVIVQSSSIGLAIAMYDLVVAVGSWLPWATLVVLAAGVLVARRRVLALVWASAALLLSMVLVLIGIDAGRTVFVMSVSSSIPQNAATTLYDGILAFVTSIVVVVAVLAATVFVVTLFAGPWRWARGLRGYGGAVLAATRRGAEKHGVTTGAVGVWLCRQRILLRVIVGLVCAAVILFVRPLTGALIVWTAVIGVLAIVVLALLSRPPVEAETTESLAETQAA